MQFDGNHGASRLIRSGAGPQCRVRGPASLAHVIVVAPGREGEGSGRKEWTAIGTPAGSECAPVAVVSRLRSLPARQERAEETHAERDLHQQQHQRGGEWHEPERLIVLEGGAAQTDA